MQYIDYDESFYKAYEKVNQIKLKNRVVKTEVFQMGIDYEKFHNASLRSNSLNPNKISKFKKEILSFHSSNPERKLLLSIDRLDYSKEIPNRLYAFEYFLDRYPHYQGLSDYAILY